MKINFNPGDVVQYNHKFLKSIQADYEIFDMKGIVKDTKVISNKTFVRVLWNGDTESHLVFSGNICKIGKDTTE